MIKIERSIVPWIYIGKMRTLNLPVAEDVIDKLFLEDCYRIGDIPYGSTVIDVGSFYGEFGIYCYKQLGCKVLAFEAARENYEIAELNASANGCSFKGYLLACKAMSDHEGSQSFGYDSNNPAESSFEKGDRPVPCTTMISEIAKAEGLWPGRKICVKLDCEGAERAIFKYDLSWLDKVYWLSMEWHNSDGHEYAEILTKAGFMVDLEGSGPKPRKQWDRSMAVGLIHARR